MGSGEGKSEHTWRARRPAAAIMMGLMCEVRGKNRLYEW